MKMLIITLALFISMIACNSNQEMTFSDGSYGAQKEREYRGLFSRGTDADPRDRFYPCDSVAPSTVASGTQPHTGFPTYFLKVKPWFVLEFSDRVDSNLYDSLTQYALKSEKWMFYLRCKGVLFDTTGWGMNSKGSVLHITEIVQMLPASESDCWP